MTYKIKWVSPNLGLLYTKLWRNLGTFDFTTEVVRAMQPEWTTSYINKNLHHLVRRGWIERLKKGKFRLRDFDEITRSMMQPDSPLEVFLNLPLKEDFLLTSYLSSQLLTGFVHTAPRITLCCTTKVHGKITNFLRAHAKALDKNNFRLWRSNITVKVIPVHPLRYASLLKRSRGVSILNKAFRITGPEDTLKYLAGEKEDRKLADIAYLVAKTGLSLANVAKTLGKKDVLEVKAMIEARKDSLIESAPNEVVEMNLVAA